MYIDNSGIEHENYDAACRYYGADTPAQIHAEMEYEFEEWMDYCSGYDFFPSYNEQNEIMSVKPIDDYIPW